MKIKAILMIQGSYHPHSSNAAALEAFSEALSGEDCRRSISPELLPALNPALFQQLPREVVQLREDVAAADGFVIAGPEYAGGMAGSLKNALDWCVGSDRGFYGKPVVVCSAGTTGGFFARQQMIRTLLWQGADVVGSLGIEQPKAKSDPRGRLIDPQTLRQLGDLAAVLLDAMQRSREERAGLVAEVAQAHGIESSPHLTVP